MAGRVLVINWTLTDLLGNPLAGDVPSSLGIDRSGGRVVIPLNDGLQAQVTASIYDRALRGAKPLTAMLKATYLQHRVFSGVIQVPDFAGGEGTVELRALDAARRLDAAPLLDPRVRYTSLDQIIEAARPARYGFPDAPDHGVKAYPGITLEESALRWPNELSQSWYTKQPTGGRGPMPLMELQRGGPAMAAIRQASQSVFGPDFAFRPIEHVPGTYDYCELDIWPRRGRELQDKVAFHFNWGADNCVDAGYAPGGDQVINGMWVELPSEAASGDEIPAWQMSVAAGYVSPDEINAFGLYAGYEGADGCGGAAGGAIAKVVAYRNPPRYFRVQPAIEGPSGGWGYVGEGSSRRKVAGLGIPPRVFEDYDVGDTVAVVAKKGELVEELEGRVTQIELDEVDQEGNVQVTVTVVPRVAYDGIDSNLTVFGGDQ